MLNGIVYLHIGAVINLAASTEPFKTPASMFFQKPIAAHLVYSQGCARPSRAAVRVCFLSSIAAGITLLLSSGCQRSEHESAPASPTTAVVAPSAPAPGTPPATGPGPVNEKGAVDYGTTQPVRPDANPQAASVGEALKNRNHPERLSPIITPAPFDLAAYQRNPQAYLNVIEPGRVFQVAQPGPEVPRIAPLSPLAVAIPQGSSTPLQVRVPPGMPVTFTSFDLGRFAENQLTSITVAANDQGVA